jgi:hypothetical protein
VRAGLTNEASLERGFERRTRNPGELTVASHRDFGRLHITAGGTWQSQGTERQRATREGNGFSLDPTFAALKLGSNWALYGGWVDHWWGPGQDGAMIFSTSARAFPKFGIRRLEPHGIDFPGLRWLGPVSFEMFAGMANEEREFDNPAVVGIRVAFQPTPWFEIGLNRGLMLCGADRPCDARIIARALLGFNDFDNTGTPDEPGNQVAGFGMSYRRPIGQTGHVLKLHFDTTAEDADNVLIDQFARQIGGGLTGPIGRDGAMYDAGIEYVDSQATRFFGRLQGGEIFVGSTYNNFLYTDGWTFGRRPLGHGYDGDARALALHGALTDTRNRRWHAAVRRITLNISSDPRYRISRTRETITEAEAGVNWPTRIGDVRMEARLQKDAPDTPGRAPLLAQGEIVWSTRF